MNVEQLGSSGEQERGEIVVEYEGMLPQLPPVLESEGLQRGFTADIAFNE
jgi:hypothetical protein